MEPLFVLPHQRIHFKPPEDTPGLVAEPTKAPHCSKHSTLSLGSGRKLQIVPDEKEEEVTQMKK